MDTQLLLKSYDLRGVFGKDLFPSDYRELWKAFARILSGDTFAVWMDARISSKECLDAFIHGVISQGKDVVDLGICSTDMLQFSTVRYPEIDAGFMVTASHNPKEYNGLKSCGKNAVPMNLREWAPRIVHAMEQVSSDAPIRGTVEKRNIVDDWAEHVVSFSEGDFSNLTIVADAGNGVGGVFMEAIAARLKCKLIPLYFEPNGDFPNHHPSPIESKNTLALREKVREMGADLGVAFDGDADRAVLCDETGSIIPASAVMCSIIERVLERKPGASIVYNAVSSEYVAEFVKMLGGTPIREKVGHVYIKETMAKNAEIEFGGEHSSHYYFRRNANADSGVIAFVHFLSVMASKWLPASELRKTYTKYREIEETNFSVKSVSQTMDRVRRAYGDIPPDFFDGMTLKTEDFRLNLRPSSNEPLLRLNLEAKNDEILEREWKKISNILKKSD